MADDDSHIYYSVVGNPPQTVSGEVSAHGTYIIRAHSDCGVEDPIGAEVVWKGPKAVTVELLNPDKVHINTFLLKEEPGKVELRVKDYNDRKFFVKITNANDVPIKFDAKVFAWVYV
eukprot:TRINITY_DN691_c0_g1_i1.p1 TRINITY_DN691_c0_g1~~TRINITY_DN691_c0_g1_i1.p1  ORF type:complete len:117 (+),score=27.92 TRINITY_DN691_c0_g1_i1:77-427(+)